MSGNGDKVVSGNGDKVVSYLRWFFFKWLGFRLVTFSDDHTWQHSLGHAPGTYWVKRFTSD